MKISVFLTLVCLLTLRIHAADICGELKNINNDFLDRSQKILSIENPSSADWASYKAAYLAYRKILDYERDAQMVPLIGLSVVSNYCYTLYRHNRYNEAMEELRFSSEHFLEKVERGSSRCYAAFVGDFNYTEQQVQHIGSGFYYIGTYVATALDDYAFAEQLLMKADERELLGNSLENNLASTHMFQYKTAKHEIDDKCFTAAYGYMMSKYAKDSLKRTGTLVPGVDADPMDILTAPAFIEYKPQRLKRYNYLDYHDYFTNLYTYLAEHGDDKKAMAQTLKMFIKVFNAERKRHGINQRFLSLLANGTDNTSIFTNVIASGDNELVQLLADFIRNNIKNDGYATDMYLIYGSYLCYYHLGNKKLADKEYKRISKKPDDRFKRLG